MTVSTITAPIAGSGAAAGPEAAGVAVRAALAELSGGEPQVVVMFAADDLGPERAAAQAQAAAGDVPVVGLTSDVLLGAPGLVRGGCVALALGSPLRAGIGVSPAASADPRAAGREAAAQALSGVEVMDSTLLLLFLDTRSGDQAEALAGAYAVAGGSVPLAGGAAAGAKPAQIAQGHAHTDSVVALAIGSPGPIGLGMSHGCSPLGVPSIVTAAEGTVVLELDGRPAEEVYLEKLGATDRDLDDDAFGDLAAVHPLAQPELSGDVRLRHVLARVPGGGLRVATHVPADAAVHFTWQSPEAIVACTRDAVEGAVMALGGVPPRAAIAFDCGGRKHVLGQALTQEAEAIARAFGDAPPPLAGLYTRGEIGRRRGAKGDRNHALVVVALG